MTLITPMAHKPASAYSWGPQATESKGGCLRLLCWSEGNSARSVLKRTDLELGWGRVWQVYGRVSTVPVSAFPSWNIWVSNFPGVRTGIEEGERFGLG